MNKRILKYCLAIALAFGLLTQADATTYLGYELETVAGNGTAGYSGDGELATTATLSRPVGSAIDLAGNLYISDFYNNVVRKVSTDRIISTLAIGSIANLNGICVDSSGNVYVASDSGIGKYNVSTNSYNPTFISNYAQAVCVDSAGYIYVAHNFPARVNKYNPTGSTNKANFITGLINPKGIFADPERNIYVADANLGRVGKYSIATNTYKSNFISNLDSPHGVAVDNSNNLCVSSGNSIKMLFAGASNLSTLVTGLSNALGIAVDISGNFYIANPAGNVISKLHIPSSAPVLEIDFTNDSKLTAPITGGLKFAGTGDCTFLGSATAGIEINAGNVKVASATPLGTSGVNMTGGSLEATAALTTPALTITNNTTVKASANNVRVATAGGNGSLTLTGAVGNEIIYLDKIASTGGVSSATNRVRFTNLTNLHANTAAFGYRLGLDGLPSSNVYGTGAVTAAELIVNTPNVPAGAFGSLTTSRIFLGSNSISQAIIAGSSS